ncbi:MULTISPECIES: C40 family peptidase [unclassified Pseudoclavibacter]|uniref:C40 family peptidase n=1 Tax=unclassified Pseudoclavibacter TaxID=2615177 RepID=UPI0012F28A7C|nr:MULTISPECIES: NlpC/P60 family protein [unclassified Pseudoclavibacter]VXB77950.1 conserved hypothetical protein [Pseudoclavibacter sp. 8L]
MENLTNATAPLTRRQAREIERRTGQRPVATVGVAGVSAPVIEASVAEINSASVPTPSASASFVHDTAHIQRNELGALVSVLPTTTALPQVAGDEAVEQLAEVIDIPEAFTGRSVSIRAAKPASLVARQRRRTAGGFAAAATVAAIATAGVVVPAAVADGNNASQAQANLLAATTVETEAPAAEADATAEAPAEEVVEQASVDLVAAPEVAVDRTETSVVTLSSDQVAEVVATPEPTATADSSASTGGTTSTGGSTSGKTNTASTGGQSVDSSSVSAAAMSYVGSYFGSCDLLTQAAYAAVGISLPRGVSAQAAMGTPTSNPQPGDLVVWPGEHIGIYAGNGMVIDDPGYGGRSVQYRSISWGSPYYVSLR